MEPVRTCVGCRARAGRSSLVRVVARIPTVIVDQSAVLPGRGAWLHPTQKCLDAALKKRAFGRALRVSTALDAAAVAEFLQNNQSVFTRTG